MRHGVSAMLTAVVLSFAAPAGATSGACESADGPLVEVSAAVAAASRHGRGVRTDVPPPAPDRDDESAPTAPKKKSAMAYTFETASAKDALEDVTAAKAKSLEAKFNGASAKTENLSAGRAGASIQGMVVDGELFVRTRAVRPGAKPSWKSAGKLKQAPKPKPATPAKPTKSLEARVKKTVAERMGLLSNPDFALKASELAEVKKGIANGEFTIVNATPKGLAGVGYTGYVAGDMLIVEKKTVRPGAKSTFYLLGPIN